MRDIATIGCDNAASLDGHCGSVAAVGPMTMVVEPPDGASVYRNW